MSVIDVKLATIPSSHIYRNIEIVSCTKNVDGAGSRGGRARAQEILEPPPALPVPASLFAIYGELLSMNFMHSYVLPNVTCSNGEIMVSFAHYASPKHHLGALHISTETICLLIVFENLSIMPCSKLSGVNFSLLLICTVKSGSYTVTPQHKGLQCNEVMSYV